MTFTRAALVTIGLAAAGTGCGRAAEPSPEALRHFTHDDVERGARRARQSRTLLALQLVWTLGVLAALVHPRVGGWLSGAARTIAGAAEGAPVARTFAAAAVGVALAIAAFHLASMPFAWVRGYFLEHAWGLSTQTAGAFAWEWLKGFAVTLVTWGAVLAAAVILRWRMPAWWPLVSWATASALMAVYVFLWPVAIDPLFSRFTPVSEPEALERVGLVASRAGIAFGEVLWSDASRRTRRTNAYFAGLGPTRRIVLYDTLRGESAAGYARSAAARLHSGNARDGGGDAGAIPAEALDRIEVVLAHEAGHWLGGHAWKGTALAVGGLAVFFAALWLLLGMPWGWMPSAAPADGARTAALIVLAAVAFEILSAPTANAVSRAFERQADRASLQLTGKPEAFVRSMAELARTNVAEIEPGRLAVICLYSHPPVLERMAAAEEYARRAEGRH